MNQITPRKAAALALHEELDKRAAEFAAILPQEVSLAEFKRVTLQAIALNPRLIECTQVSLFRALTDAARNGWVPDGRDCYIDIRENFKTHELSAICIPGKHGYMKQFIGKTLLDWRAHVVRRGDNYEVELGDNEHFTHKVDPFRAGANDGEIIGAYSIAIGLDGRVISREFMSIDQLLKARAKSSSFNGKKPEYSPWSTHFEEMCEKTVMKRHADRLPRSAVASAVMAAERAIDHEDAVMLAGAPAAPARRVGRPRNQPAAELPAPNPQPAQPAAERQARTASQMSPQHSDTSHAAVGRPDTSTQSDGGARTASRSNGSAQGEWDDARSAANGTQHGDDTDPRTMESSTESSASPKRRGRPTNAEVAARSQANMRQHPPRQEDRRPQQTKIEGGSEAGDEIDELDKIRIEGEQAYESGIPRDAVPREYKRADALDKLTAWREGWDAAADDSAGGSQYMA